MSHKRNKAALSKKREPICKNRNNPRDCCIFVVCQFKCSCKKKKHNVRHKQKKPIKVVSKNFDIRNLTPARDKVEIFGAYGDQLRAVRTDELGRLEVTPSPGARVTFIEETFLNIEVTDQFTTLPEQDTSTKTMTSYAVVNRGENPAIIRLEISPNSVDYVTDLEHLVPPNSMRVFVPNRFLKWTRLLISTERTGMSTLTDVYFQSQTAS